jgi:general stress protein YciG
MSDGTRMRDPDFQEDRERACGDAGGAGALDGERGRAREIARKGREAIGRALQKKSSIYNAASEQLSAQ